MQEELGCSALGLAVALNRSEAIDYLKQFRSEFQQKIASISTVCFKCSPNTFPQLKDMFLEFDLKDEHGNTALMDAIRYQCFSAAKQLLQ